MCVVEVGNRETNRIKINMIYLRYLHVYYVVFHHITSHRITPYPPIFPYNYSYKSKKNLKSVVVITMMIAYDLLESNQMPFQQS